MRDSYKGIICRDCRKKIGDFTKKGAAGALAVAGTAVAGLAVKKKGTDGLEKRVEEIEEKIKSIPVAESADAVRNVGKKVLEEGRETVNLAESFIEEHTMGARDLIERGIDAVEYRLKGLPAAYAREEHPILGKKIKDRIDRLKGSDKEEE